MHGHLERQINKFMLCFCGSADAHFWKCSACNTSPSFPWQQTENSPLAQYQTKNIQYNEPSDLIRNFLHYNKHIQTHHCL